MTLILGYFRRFFRDLKFGLLWPLRAYERHDLERDEIIVKLGGRAAAPVLRRWMLYRFAFMVVVLACSLIGHFDDGPFGDVCGAVATIGYGMALGLVPLRSYRRSKAYRNGWIDGRGKAVKNLLQRQPPSVDEWLTETYVFDSVHVLGLGIDPESIPDDPSGIR